jgi:transcription initiation factor TFIIIB Brf1 subunit/transcription initiation factor TFIIB
MVRSLYDITECKDCASQNIIHNEKLMQIICKDCGLIYDPMKPIKEVGIGLRAAQNTDRIIRPVEKKQVARKPVRRPAVKKQKPKKSKPVKPRKKTLGAKVKGLMRKLIRRK